MELNDIQRKFLEDKLNKLNKSTFRTSFKLKEKEIKFVEEKGYDVLEKHAEDFIRKRLAPGKLDNDGKQTPTKGHPVFVAQHATACCCRGCLLKWHHIPKNRDLTEKEIRFVVSLLIYWIKNNYNERCGLYEKEKKL